MLTASEVALLPTAVLQLYKKRSVKEQQAVATHTFFESLIKPWALEPSKLSTQVGERAILCKHARDAARMANVSILHCIKAAVAHGMT